MGSYKKTAAKSGLASKLKYVPFRPMSSRQQVFEPYSLFSCPMQPAVSRFINEPIESIYYAQSPT